MRLVVLVLFVLQCGSMSVRAELAFAQGSPPGPADAAIRSELNEPLRVDGNDVAAARLRQGTVRRQAVVETPPTWRNLALGGAYGSVYTGAAKIGSRLGLQREFKVIRLESAWAIDVFGHLYASQKVAAVFRPLHRWAGDDDRTARRRAAWFASFGALTYMETINGFMPGVRFDWMDPIANAAGAWMADGGEDFAVRHEWASRLSLELGYKSWSRLSEPDDEKGALTRIWHDYPNQRYGVGYAIGPVNAEWLRVFGTYGVTSLSIEELRNQWGMGVELKPHNWLGNWIEQIPGGHALLGALRWADRQILVPGIYFQLFTVETGPFTQREPFDE